MYVGRVKFLVSSDMVKLRNTQKMLNEFVWTTDICYGYLLKNIGNEITNPNKPAYDFLGDVDSGAWFPNNQGNLKYPGTIGEFINTVKLDYSRIYRSVIVYFYSSLDDYITNKNEDVKTSATRTNNVKYKNGGMDVTIKMIAEKNKREKDELKRSLIYELSNETLIHPTSPSEGLRFEKVVIADIFRRIRNLLVHDYKFDISTLHTNKDLTEKWEIKMLKIAKSTYWSEVHSELELENIIHKQMNGLVLDTLRSQKNALENGEKRQIPLDYFYMLFSLTAFDNMAIEMEEAFNPKREYMSNDFWVYRHTRAIRRKDLIL